MTLANKRAYIPETETDTEDFFRHHMKSSSYYQNDSQPLFEENTDSKKSENKSNCKYKYLYLLIVFVVGTESRTRHA